eukprot:gene2223-2531_t
MTILARSEKTLFVKCTTSNALLEGDFEPKMVPTITSVYATRNRIIPNVHGLFPVTVLNIATSDIHLKSRNLMGFIQPTSEIISSISACENKGFDINDITLSTNLSATETSQLKLLITDYKDVFATIPKIPKKADLLEHQIITNDALPIHHKPHRIPVAWEKDVDEQSITLSEEDKQKTVFAVSRRKSEFNVMPFGLCSSGASYQRMMDMCLTGLSTNKVLSYMDDIAFFSDTFDKHMPDLAAVFAVFPRSKS